MNMDKGKKEDGLSICNVPFIGDIYNSNFNISENILDAYYWQARQPKSKEEVPDYYIGKLNQYVSPYTISWHGAYILADHWEILELYMKGAKEGDSNYKDYTTVKVSEALKEYARGFQYGWDNFIDDKIITKDSLSSSENFKAQKIMDFLSSHMSCRGFSQSIGKGGPFKHWYDDGIRAGYHYRAWYLILENHKLFESYFEEKEKISTGKKSAVASYALMHVFWGKIDSNKNITKTNCKMWADAYDISKNTLLQHFSDQYEKKDREPDQKMIDNKKYLNPYFKRFEDALKMLEPLSNEAFDYGTKELNSLKERYEVI